VAGDQLDLQIVLKAILDGKGFEQAQTTIKGLAAQANTAAAPVRKLGESFGGTRGPVADVTRVLLMNIGVTGAAGEAAKAAGTAMYFMEGAATASNVAVASSVAVFALAIPWIMELARGNKTASEAQKTFADALGITLDQLQQVVDKAPGATRELQGLLAVLRAEKSKTQTDSLKEMAERLKAIRSELANGDLNRKLEAATGKDLTFYPSLKDAVERARALREEQSGLLVKAHELERALLEGKNAGEQADIVTHAMEEADRAAAKALELRKKAQEDLNAAFAEGRQGQRPNLQQALDEDAAKLAERERKQKQGALSDEVKDLLVFGNIKLREKKELANAEMEIDRALAQEKRANTQAAIGDIGASLSALSSAFGGNKALAIAGAIADTAAGAARALGPEGPPWPYNLVAAASVAAAGLAQVVNIRKAEPTGFDDPFSDLLAEKLGRKSAADFVKHFGVGFHGAMAGSGGGSTTTVYNQNTYNQGQSIGSVNTPGFIGAGRTEFMKHLRRELIKAERLERRTTLGR
jgi:hypothetical protein